MTKTLEQTGNERWIKISDNFEYLIENDPLEVLERRTTEREGMYYGVGGKI